MSEFILVTYTTSPELADIFRDAKSSAFGIPHDEFRGARDRPCCVWVGGWWLWGGGVRYLICLPAAELPPQLSKHVWPDCYVCGVVGTIVVGTSMCLSSWVLYFALVQVVGGGFNKKEYDRAFHASK